MMKSHERLTTLKDYGGIYLRGLCMGAADIVPGVSGGTIALIAGIYDRLLAAIAAFDVKALKLFFSGQMRQVWRHVDGAFLVSLLLGIGSAVVVLAQVIQDLLANHPQPLWSFFFGLVLASALFLRREELPATHATEFLAIGLGALLAALVGLAPQAALPDGFNGFMLAGALAICAMILPGISGSFILLLLGMYGPVISAIGNFQFDLLAGFAIGCAGGLLVFTRLLSWVLDHFRRVTMAVLTGFLVGSLVTLWPWQSAITMVIDRQGESRVVQSVPVLPTTFSVEHGDSQIFLCCIAALFGASLVFLVRVLASTPETRVQNDR